MSSEIRAVVFDFDGLVLDTEVPVYASWCAAFEAHGAPPPTIEEWSVEIGTSGSIDMHAWLIDRADRPVDLDVMNESRRAHRDALLAREHARPGVIAWLAEADATGLASRSHRARPRIGSTNTSGACGYESVSPLS